MTRYVTLAAALLFGCAPAPSTSAPPLDELTAGDRVADPACGAHWIAGVRGLTVDETGVPVSGAQVQMCLRLPDHTQLCMTPVETDDDGWYALVLPAEARCLERVVVRVVIPGGTHGTSFQAPSMAPVEGVLDVVDPVVLWPIERPIAAPPMGDPDQARTLRFASGLELDVVPSALDFPDSYDLLASAPVPPGRAPAALRDLEGVYALGPEEGAFPGLDIRIPAPDLPDGARAELFLVGGIYTELPDGRYVEESERASFGTATARGGFLEPDPGSELSYLTWLGWRRTP